jgi:hypothetical protein
MEVGVGIGVQRWSLHSSAKIARRVTGNLRDSASYHNFTASIISEWVRIVGHFKKMSDKLQLVAATRRLCQKSGSIRFGCAA